jgi:hypothetical protein
MSNIARTLSFVIKPVNQAFSDFHLKEMKAPRPALTSVAGNPKLRPSTFLIIDRCAVSLTAQKESPSDHQLGPL